jgi:hypothetical protein
MATLLVLGTAAVLPQAAAAAGPGAPVVVTAAVSNDTATSATVSGTVNPEGLPTTYYAQYDYQYSRFCQSGGVDTLAPPAPTTTPPQTLGFTDASPHPVAVSIAGLNSHTKYCVQLVAVNQAGTTTGTVLTFTTGSPPVVVGGSATATGASTERFTGTVNPNGFPTTYTFNYAPAASPWCMSNKATGPPQSTPAGYAGAGTTAVTVSGVATGLSPGTKYCWALAAVAGGVTSQTTLGEFLAGLPGVVTLGVSGLRATAATLHGAVNPAGNPTEYAFQYDLATSAWCASAGTTGTPAHETPITPVGLTDTAVHDISAAVAGLNGGTTYCFRAIAGNAAGQVSGNIVSFTTPAPPPPTQMLTVMVAGTGTGSVTGGGLDCPGTCRASYPVGTSVTLTAAPASGSTFAGWGAPCAGTRGSCTLTLSGDLTVSATFTKKSVPPPKKPAPSCSLRVKSRRVWLRRHKHSHRHAGTVSLKARCTESAAGTLRTTVTTGKRHRRIAVKRVTLSLRANSTRVVLVTLPSKALAALRNKQHVTATFNLVVGNANGTARAQTRIARLRARR